MVRNNPYKVHELKQNFRCYHFGNFYLSSIQQAVQSAHAQMEMFVKYTNRSKRKNDLYHWAKNDKTMICLSGGNHASLSYILQKLDTHNNPYAWSSFHEDKDSLNGMLTNVAIILPFEIYNAAEEIRNGVIDDAWQYFSNPEDDFKRFIVNLLVKSRLAS